MTDTNSEVAAPKLIRMSGGGNITEWNFSGKNGGLFSPDKDGHFLVPEPIVDHALQAGLVRDEPTRLELFADVAGAIEALGDCSLRTALRSAIAEESLRMRPLAS